MRLLWVCNVPPGVICGGSGLWMDHMLAELRQREDLTIHILARAVSAGAGTVDERLSYCLFEEPVQHAYASNLEVLFRQEVLSFRPDVVHIWGTEFGHTLAMTRVCRKLGLGQKCVISIQGLCGIYAPHYAEGVPYRVQRSATLRDFLRRDNILRQQKKYALRGEMEAEALANCRHVIGRTHWDEACMRLLAPRAEYHFCNETLRPNFYRGQWAYATCKKHRIFTSSMATPVKGFHYLLEAFRLVLRSYPDATLAVPGESFLELSPRQKLLQQSYHHYLARLAKKYGVAEKIEFLGHLSPEKMQQAFLDSHVFVLPSTIENSPNSLGEAMLLGLPCVAADVGGVTTMLRSGREGYVYPSTAPYMLADSICRIFRMEDQAASLGQAAREHALQTHDPQSNLSTLEAIYARLAENPKEETV